MNPCFLCSFSNSFRAGGFWFLQPILFFILITVQIRSRNLLRTFKGSSRLTIWRTLYASLGLGLGLSTGHPQYTQYRLRAAPWCISYHHFLCFIKIYFLSWSESSICFLIFFTAWGVFNYTLHSSLKTTWKLWRCDMMMNVIKPQLRFWANGWGASFWGDEARTNFHSIKT